jgi:hypothetical protein
MVVEKVVALLHTILSRERCFSIIAPECKQISVGYRLA